MTFFILLYVIAVIGFLFLLLTLYKKYIGLNYGRYLLLGIVSFIFWLVLYMLAFTTTFNPDILLYISRALYSLSFISTYSMTLFFLYFWIRGHKKSKKYNIQNIFLLVFFLILWVSIFSDFFISDMIYEETLEIHYEQFWLWFIFFQIWYFLNPIITSIVIFFSYKRLYGINKLRLKYMALGYLIFLFLYALFLAVLPTFGIWILQKEQILFFVPFLLSFFYASHRYKFTNLNVGIGIVTVFILSIACSFLIIYFLKLYLSLLDTRLLWFWGIYDSGAYFSIFDFIIGVFLFYFFYKYFSKTLITPFNKWAFVICLNEIRNKLPFLENKNSLNLFLWNEFNNKLNISDTHVIFNDDLLKKDHLKELESYFYSDSSREIFLNDIVFLDENKTKFDSIQIRKELDKRIALYVPIYKDNKKILAFLAIWRKPFYDFYSSLEIDLIKNFAVTLQGHLKYLSIYKKFQDLSIALDKKVDEKTIEYNNLLNKQKEFIAYVGHEIKNPITNSIFLCDSLVDEIRWLKEWNIETSKKLDEDGKILYDELIKVSKLVKSIFSTEQFDLNKVKLYKKSTDITSFLYSEIYAFENSNPSCYFDVTIKKLWQKEIDDTQLRQVIHNLLTNALKFAHKESPRIYISAKKRSNDKIEISIEDNWKGFDQIDMNLVFDKYATWDGSSVGLGMWLYLCKKIVELHNGKISAGNSEKLGGAQFTITF